MALTDNEVIFIEYDGIIKSPIPYILNKLQAKEFKDNYKDFIDYSKFENFDEPHMLSLISRRLYKNILKYLATDTFDYDLTYNDLLSRYDDVYAKSKLLSIGQSISILTHQSFVTKVYIYSEVYDKRIENDISSEYSKLNNIVYVSGDFKSVIEEIPERITSYILQDIDYVSMLIDMKKLEYTNVLIAKYGFNYILDKETNFPMLKIPDLDNVMTENIFKMAEFAIDIDMSF